MVDPGSSTLQASHALLEELSTRHNLLQYNYTTTAPQNDYIVTLGHLPTPYRINQVPKHILDHNMIQRFLYFCYLPDPAENSIII